MEKETYIILRRTETADSESFLEKNVLGPTPSSSDWSEAEDQSLSVETVNIDQIERQEIRHDPGIADMALAIPISLIQPIPLDSDDESKDGDDMTWGLTVTGAHTSPYTGKGITVAVLDTGVDAKHEAFSGIDLVEKDFTGEGNQDFSGHGTHVAGTIFGQPDGSMQYSIAPGIKRALIGKVLGQSNSSTEQIFHAIQWAIDEGANIINMSLGFDFPGLVKRRVSAGWPVELATSNALKAYRDNVRLFDSITVMNRQRSNFSVNSALLIAAAGNESKREQKAQYKIDVAPPSAAEGIISVGALGTSGAPHSALTVAPFSNINPTLCAPGMSIHSAKAGGGYVRKSGTSMASPHVAGVAALWMEWQLERIGRINYDMVHSKLVGSTTTQNLSNPNDVEGVGAGLIQAPA